MVKPLKSQKTIRCEVDTDDDFNVISEFPEYIADYTEYTPAGNIKSGKSFNLHGEIMEKIEYIFDEQDILKEQLMYYDEEEVVERRTYDYDETGKLIRVNKYYSDGSHEYTLYFYDQSNKLVEKRRFSQDDEPEETEQFEYVDGNLIRESVYDQDMKLISEQRLIKKGNSLERQMMDIDTGTSKITEEYNDEGQKIKTLVYDKKDRLVTRQNYFYENGKVSKIAEETAQGTDTTLLHYNMNGDVILQEEIDANDFYRSRISRDYNDDNILLKTQVYVNNYGKTADLNYILKLEYEYYE
jgi:hypothetical protein